MTAEAPTPHELLAHAVDAVRSEPLADARRRFAAAASAFAASGDRRGEASAWVEEARALAGSFEPEALAEADDLVHRALGVVEDSPEGDPSTLHADAMHVSGYVHLRAGRFDEAATVLQAAERLYRMLGDAKGEARVLDTLGVLYERERDPERAALCLAHSHALKQRLGDEAGVAISLGNLGRLALHGGKPWEAEGFLRLDLEIAQKLGDARGEGVVRTNLAEALVAQGRTDEARTIATDAREAAASVGNHVGLGYAELALAEVALAEGEDLDAGEHAEAARKAFDQARMDAGRAAAWLFLAKLAGAGRAGGARALLAARLAARASQPELSIDALLEAHTLLGAGPAADRALRRAHAAALASPQRHLVERVRRRQASHDMALALRADLIELHVTDRVEGFDLRDGRLAMKTEGYLGSGAFATVLRVRDEVTGRVYAWKQLHVAGERLGELTERLRREYSVLARVPPHPSLVRVHALGTRDGAPGLLMDLLEAPGRHASLQAALDDVGALPTPVALGTAADVAEGLAVLHEACVVHRDVKPANVLFGGGGQATLTDCGLAFDALDRSYVATSSFAGSIAYAPPEQFGGEDVKPSPAADVYALGMLLFRALTNAWPLPLEGAFVQVVEAKLVRDADLALVADDPSGLRDLLGALLSREPTDRPTASDAAAALRAMLGA